MSWVLEKQGAASSSGAGPPKTSRLFAEISDSVQGWGYLWAEEADGFSAKCKAPFVRTDAGGSCAASAEGACLLAFILMEGTGKGPPKWGFDTTEAKWFPALENSTRHTALRHHSRQALLEPKMLSLSRSSCVSPSPEAQH